jgi:hypothetical protein
MDDGKRHGEAGVSIRLPKGNKVEAESSTLFDG